MEKAKNATPKPETIPIYVYDDMAARNTHRERIHWIFHIIQLVVMGCIIAGFIWYLNQYEYVSNESVTVDGSNGIANYVGKDGDIYNGEDSYKTLPVSTQEERALQGNP